MNNDSSQPSLRDYLAVARRRWFIVVGAVVAGALAGGLFAASQANDYRAVAQALLGRQNVASALTGTPDSNSLQVYPERLGATQSDIARSPVIAERVAQATAFGPGPRALLDRSSVEPKVGADMLQFFVTDANAARAQQLATAYANAYVTYRRELDSRALDDAMAEVQRRIDVLDPLSTGDRSMVSSLNDRLDQLGTLKTLQTASAVVVPTEIQPESTSRGTLRSAVLGALVGLVVGGLIALLIEALDTRSRSPLELARVLRAPLLGRLPRRPRGLPATEVIDSIGSGIFTAKALRVLRVNLGFALDEDRSSTVLVTGAVAGQGATTTACDLAVALAAARRRVLLVDLDFHNPSLHDHFGLASRQGAEAVISGRCSLEQALQTVSLDVTGSDRRGRLDILCASPSAALKVDLTADPRVGEVLSELTAHADIVIVNAPPVLEQSDAMTLARMVDGVVVVTRANVTRIPAIAELKRLLDAVGAPVIGFVETGVRGNVIPDVAVAVETLDAVPMGGRAG